MNSEKHLSPETVARVTQHLDRLLTTPAFVNSARSRSFLLYVVKETLAGRASQIKERNIAIDVFGKSEDYDPQEHSGVRVGAADVRRRLLTAYQTGLADGVRIVLPVGSYCPQFEVDVQEIEVQPPAPSFEVSVPEPKAEPQPKAEPEPKTEQRSADLWWVMVLSFFVCLAAAGLITFHSLHKRPTDEVWGTFTNLKRPVLLVLPTPPIIYGPLTPAVAEKGGDTKPGQFQAISGEYTGIGAGVGAVWCAEQLAKRDQPFIIRAGAEASYTDIQHSPAVLFGGFSSEIGIQLTSKLRYRISGDPRVSYIVDSEGRGPGWSAPKRPGAKTREGYALVTMIRRTESGVPMMVVAGFTAADTLAAAQFITDDLSIREVALKAGPHWSRNNYQLVLHQWIYNNSPSRATVVGWNIW